MTTKFAGYNFENNGDIFGIDDDSANVYVGRCDEEGDIRLEEDYLHLASDIGECLSDTMQRAMPGHILSGDLSWTPDICWLRAMDWEDRYCWNSSEKCWEETVSFPLIHSKCPGSLRLDSDRIAEALEDEELDETRKGSDRS